MPVTRQDVTITEVTHQCAVGPFCAHNVHMDRGHWIWEGHRIWFCPYCGEDLEQSRKEAS